MLLGYFWRASSVSGVLTSHCILLSGFALKSGYKGCTLLAADNVSIANFSTLSYCLISPSVLTKSAVLFKNTGLRSSLPWIIVFPLDFRPICALYKDLNFLHTPIPPIYFVVVLFWITVFPLPSTFAFAMERLSMVFPVNKPMIKVMIGMPTSPTQNFQSIFTPPP